MSLGLNIPLLGGASDIAASQQSKPDKLHGAAQQFESLLIGEMLKSAREAGSDGWLGSGDSTGDDSAMDMAESQLANSLSASGGLGLAKVIEHSMAKPAQNTADKQPASSGVSSLKKP
ncbi:MAG: rod-binding protein [Acidobacteriota bacterium]|nr:rod-binding protein [Acidobacteriota bacterium]